MNTEKTFFATLRDNFTHGGMSIKLIFINVIVFFFIRILDVFGQLGGKIEGVFIENYINPIFGLYSTFFEYIKHPWGLFTNIFTHYEARHLILNMLFLYFVGRSFETIFGQKRLLFTYILGGVLGGLFEIFAHSLFPRFELTSSIVIGASGAFMAILIAVAFYRPKTKIDLRFAQIPIIYIAVAFMAMDILNLASHDKTAHFAHLGGAIFGIWSIQNIHSPSNIVNRFYGIMAFIAKMFIKDKTGHLKVKKDGKSARGVSDEDYNSNKKSKQEVTDKILDKISKSGYDSLTKSEKDYLFNQSKND